MHRLRVSPRSIAEFFSLIAGMLLLPGVFGALFGVYEVFFFRWGEYPEELQAQVTPDEWAMAIGIVAALVLGCVLLWGYLRRANDRPVSGGNLVLWLTTALYNAVPVGFVLSTGASPSEIPWLLMPLLLWWLSAIVLALAAAALELRERSVVAPDRQPS